MVVIEECSWSSAGVSWLLWFADLLLTEKLLPFYSHLSQDPVHITVVLSCSVCQKKTVSSVVYIGCNLGIFTMPVNFPQHDVTCASVRTLYEEFQAELKRTVLHEVELNATVGGYEGVVVSLSAFLPTIVLRKGTRLLLGLQISGFSPPPLLFRDCSGRKRTKQNNNVCFGCT